jgi:hypothetical protein
MCPVAAAAILVCYLITGSALAQTDTNLTLRITLPQTLVSMPASFTRTIAGELVRQQQLLDSLLLLQTMMRRKVNGQLQEARELQIQSRALESEIHSQLKKQYHDMQQAARGFKTAELPVAILSVILQVTQLLKNSR